MNTDSDPSEDDHSSPSPPAPRISWLIAGSALLLAGILMLVSVLMTPVGIAVCVIGILLVVASFVSQTGRPIRTENESGSDASEQSIGLLKRAEHKLEDIAKSQALPKDKLHTKRV